MVTWKWCNIHCVYISFTVAMAMDTSSMALLGLVLMFPTIVIKITGCQKWTPTYMYVPQHEKTISMNAALNDM